jgi:hypothetical protein
MTLQNQVKECNNKKQRVIYKYSINLSNVCFLCGKKGHYGSPTSCHAAKQVRKTYFN